VRGLGWWSVLRQAALSHTACRYYQPGQLRMEATRPIRDGREVARMEGRCLQKFKHAIIHRWSRQFHEVVHQRIAPTPPDRDGCR
jgi:hypothetical protein